MHLWAFSSAAIQKPVINTFSINFFSHLNWFKNIYLNNQKFNFEKKTPNIHFTSFYFYRLICCWCQGTNQIFHEHLIDVANLYTYTHSKIFAMSFTFAINLLPHQLLSIAYSLIPSNQPSYLMRKTREKK